VKLGCRRGRTLPSSSVKRLWHGALLGLGDEPDYRARRQGGSALRAIASATTRYPARRLTHYGICLDAIGSNRPRRTLATRDHPAALRRGTRLTPREPLVSKRAAAAAVRARRAVMPDDRLWCSPSVGREPRSECPTGARECCCGHIVDRSSALGGLAFRSRRCALAVRVPSQSRGGAVVPLRQWSRCPWLRPSVWFHP
jgi:hypothetical protein